MASVATPTTVGVFPCLADVVYVGSERYAWRPVCSCGWATRGFVAEHAARGAAEAHVAGEW
jgi:hypothetical protein